MRDPGTTRVIVSTHEYEFVPPNEIRYYLRGIFDGPDVEAHFEFAYKYADLSGGMVNCVVDVTKFERATDSARHLLTRVERPYPYYGCALLGANFASRTVANMIIAAGRLLTPKSFTYPIKFVDTWAEAHAWFEELRSQR